jgi:uncharacterized membrane protein YraQ (UPF0718 family)
MNQLGAIFTGWLSLLLDGLPFILLGVVFSGLLFVFIGESRLVRRLPKHPLGGALVGSLLGLIFPVCKYGNIPVVRRLLLQGVSLPVAIAFLLASPTINPIVIWFTWKAFESQPEILGLRLLLTGAIATIIGYIFSFSPELRSNVNISDQGMLDESATLEPGVNFTQSGTFLLAPTLDPAQTLKSTGKVRYGYLGDGSPPQTFASQLDLFLANTIREFLELASILAIGCVIAATIQVLLPQGLLLSWGNDPVTAIGVLMAFGVILAISPTTDSFLGSMLAHTFSNGSVLAFLLSGSMIDLKQITLMVSTFSLKTIVYLLILVIHLTFLLTLFIDFNFS